MRLRYRENKLRLEPDVKYKGQHRSACVAVTGAAANVTFSFGIIAIAVTRAFEKLADGLLALPSPRPVSLSFLFVLGSAPAFFPARYNGHRRVNRDNKWDRELAEYSIYLRSLIVPLSPYSPLLYVSRNVGKARRARKKEK